MTTRAVSSGRVARFLSSRTWLAPQGSLCPATRSQRPRSSRRSGRQTLWSCRTIGQGATAQREAQVLGIGRARSIATLLAPSAEIPCAIWAIGRWTNPVVPADVELAIHLRWPGAVRLNTVDRIPAFWGPRDPGRPWRPHKRPTGLPRPCADHPRFRWCAESLSRFYVKAKTRKNEFEGNRAASV